MLKFSEKDLIPKLQNPVTRADAFCVMVNGCKEQIYWYVRRMVTDYDDAKDITQNVFIKAWENLDDFNYRSNIYTWLYRIATNEALNHLQRKSRQEATANEAHLASSPQTESGQYISADEIYWKLEKAIALLPEKQRAVFILRYFEDKSYEEIALITNTTVGALHASYHIAVKKIEEFLRDD